MKILEQIRVHENGILAKPFHDGKISEIKIFNDKLELTIEPIGSMNYKLVFEGLIDCTLACLKEGFIIFDIFIYEIGGTISKDFNLETNFWRKIWGDNKSSKSLKDSVKERIDLYPNGKCGIISSSYSGEIYVFSKNVYIENY